MKIRMKKTIVKYIAPFAGFIAVTLPTIAFAQYQVNNFTSLVTTTNNIINTIIPILISIGVLFFIYGVVKYIRAKDEGEREAGKNTMIQGVIGLFIIVSIWGLVGILTNTFGTSKDALPIPTYIPTN